MFNKKILLFGLVFSSIFWSCNNDLELFTDPIDLPFIYGIIKSNDTNHYVKVTRTYQKWSEEVELSDLYYEDDSIHVFIDEFSGNNLVASHPALPVTAHDKAEGIFPHPTHKYYKVGGTLLSNKNNHTYSIRVELANGKVAKNQEPFKLQKNIGVNRPNLQVQTGILEIDFEDPSGNTAPYRFHWGQSGGGREELIFTVALLETNIETNVTDTVVVPITVYNGIPTDKNGNAIELFGLPELYTGLSKYLEKNSKLRRQMLKTQIEYVGPVQKAVGFGLGLDIWSESKVLTTYETIMYSQTQDGISKDIPNFSNLNNAVGLFSTRSHRQVTLESDLLFFGPRTLDSLACSPSFYEYNFARSYINSLGEVEFDYSSQRCK